VTEAVQRGPTRWWARRRATLVRSVSTPARLGAGTVQVREQRDSLGAPPDPKTSVVVSVDLDDFQQSRPAATGGQLGVGTANGSLVTGSGAPPPTWVYTLSSWTACPVQKVSQPQGIPRLPQGGACGCVPPDRTIPESGCTRLATPPRHRKPGRGLTTPLFADGARCCNTRTGPRRPASLVLP